MEETKNEDWRTDDINEDSVKRSVSAGEIYPTLALPKIKEGKTRSDETILVKFLENPKVIYTKEGPSDKGYVSVVEHQGAKWSLWLSKSLRYNLRVECEKNNLRDSDGNITLLGHRFVIGTHMQETKYGKKQPLAWAQYKPKGEPIEEPMPQPTPPAEDPMVKNGLQPPAKPEGEGSKPSPDSLLKAKEIFTEAEKAKGIVIPDDIHKKLKDAGLPGAVETIEELEATGMGCKLCGWYHAQEKEGRSK